MYENNTTWLKTKNIGRSFFFSM
uniref:Uncharacterized protein n=1 Tax=Rhizophora mucronata TaxID=61149 RepID=A0A2P2P2V7_RHIMU